MPNGSLVDFAMSMVRFVVVCINSKTDRALIAFLIFVLIIHSLIVFPNFVGRVNITLLRFGDGYGDGFGGGDCGHSVLYDIIRK